MVEHKPYAAIITPIVQVRAADQTLGNPQKGAAVTARVYFERLTPGEVLREYGLDLRDPAVLQCELVDAGKFESPAGNGVQVDVGGRTYRVVGRPEIHDLGDACDHADVLLEGLQTPL